VDEWRVDTAARSPECGDITIEVWSPRAEPAKPRILGFLPREWIPHAAAVLLITAGVILLTRRR